jgi:hypothetical protein
VASVVLFAGPSAQGVPLGLLQHRDIDLRPPVRRGDVDLLIQQQPPAVAVLCDGVFKSAPAVSHAELCRALDVGWQIWGVSSIGAIRAHEMRTEGMRGYGWVHAQFSRHDDFTDDELCLLHLPQPPYEPITEALVNLRYALETHGPALGIGSAASASIIAELRPIWFGDRWCGTASRPWICEVC